MTTRAETQWVNPDPAAVRKLQFSWVNRDRDPFSFDIGGVLKGGSLEGEIFVGESKYYHVYGELATHYRKFLAQCYCAFLDRPSMCDNFFFISWHPFSVKTWNKLLDVATVKEAVVEHTNSTLRVTNDSASLEVDEAVCEEVSKRLWLLILSERQEKELIMSPNDLAMIRARRTEKEYEDA